MGIIEQCQKSCDYKINSTQTIKSIIKLSIEAELWQTLV